MKRKLFNAALFGAVLVAAPVSTFVSCADYDSDIAGVQQSVDDLKGVVNQKETEIKAQIANLQGQKDALDTRIAALEESLDKTSTSVDLETCKAECKEARGLLEKAIEDLKKSLDEAKTKIDAQGETISGLLSADGELQKGIDAAKGDLTVLDGRLGELETLVGTLADGLDAAQDDLRNLVEGLPELKNAVKQANEDLGNLKSFVSEELAKVRDEFAKADATLQGQITANKELIEGLRNSLSLTPEQFESLKELASLDLEFAANITSTIASLQEGSTVALSDIQELKAWCHDLETDAIAHGVQIDKNTKAIVDLLVRMVDAELAISEATNKLATLVANFDAFKAEQKALDDAQDLEIAAAVAAYYDQEKGVSYNFTNINEAYASALKAAKAAADVAYQNALSNTSQYYYTKDQIDHLIAAVSGDASGDLEAFISQFREWVEVDLNGLLAEKFGDVDGQLEDIWNDLTALHTDLGNIQEGLHDLETDVIANTAKIKEIEDAYKAADEQFKKEFRAFLEEDLLEIIGDIYEAMDDLGVAVSKEVKSLVLEPDSYYQGIQAIEGTSYHYVAWDVTNSIEPVQGEEVTKYCPEVVAHYHVNPSLAKLSTDVNNYAFAVLDRQHHRGVNNLLQPKVDKVAQNGGMLDVTLSLGNAGANLTNNEEGIDMVTVMALQYTNPSAKAENQVVTSDYAALYLNPLNGVSLVAKNESTHELADKSATVDVNGDLGYVAYNAEEPFCIEDQVMVQFGDETAVSVANLPGDFKVTYTYVAGDINNFSAITEDGKVKPQLSNGKPATTACIGKNATWRIDVKRGNDVVEVGFYKVIITGEAVVETAEEVTIDDRFNVACSPYVGEVALSHNEIDIKNVWDKVVAITGEDLATVQAKYSLSLAAKNPDNTYKCVQFDAYKGEGGRTLYKQIAGKGTIDYDVNNGKIKWAVPYTDPAVEGELLATSGNKTITTYIRVRSVDAISKDTYNEFYLPVIWKPNFIEEWGEYQPLHWTYTRVANQWQQSSNNADEKEIRIYPDLTQGGVLPYIYNIPEKAMVGFNFDAIHEHLSFEDATNNPAFTAQGFTNVYTSANPDGYIKPYDGKFRFIEHPKAEARQMVVNGDTYYFSVSTDGKNLRAAKGEGGVAIDIATINDNGVVKLENNATSQLLLNAYEKDQLAYGQTLCARVGFVAKCCAGEVKVIDGDFDVRFIKPITVDTKDAIEIMDGDSDIEGKVTTDITSKIVIFNGANLSSHPEYLSKFGIQIKIDDPATWKTNYNADATDFSKTLAENKIDEQFSVKNVEIDGESQAVGVVYVNNGAVVSEYSVLIPVTVSHTWNATEIKSVIRLDIKRTKGNSNRR